MMIKLFNTHQVQIIGKLVTPGLLVTVARLKNTQKASLKSIPTLFMCLLRKKFLRRLPKDQYSVITAQNIIQHLTPSTN